MSERAYDHPAYLARDVVNGGLTEAGNGAASAKFVAHAALKLKAVHVAVDVAGTSAGAGNGLTFKVGTTSIGSIALGTNTAGVTTSVDLGNAQAARGQVISAENGTDATGQAVVTYEYELVPMTDLSD